MTDTILFFHASAELYGSDRTLLQLAAGLDRAHRRCVVALPREGQLVRELRAVGAEVEIGPVGTFGRATLRPRGLLRAANELPRSVAWARRLVRRHRPALVHSNTIVVLSGALAARAERVPHLWHVHEILERPRWLARATATAVERLSTRVACNSHATARHMLASAPRLSAKCHVVHNGIEPFPDRPELADTRAARRALGLAECDLDAPWIALVGRINAWKGQRVLLEACARLRDRHPRLHVLLAGDAPPGQPHFVAALAADVRALGLVDRVVHLPFQSEVELVHAAADIVVVPSTRPEPFGLVAVEAMSLGRPVVAARHGGLTEIVVDGESGLLCTPGDVDELARALDRLLSDPEHAARLGAAGRARQRELFTVERYCAEFDGLYASMIRADRELRPPPRPKVAA